MVDIQLNSEDKLKQDPLLVCHLASSLLGSWLFISSITLHLTQGISLVNKLSPNRKVLQTISTSGFHEKGPYLLLLYLGAQRATNNISHDT